MHTQYTETPFLVYGWLISIIVKNKEDVMTLSFVRHEVIQLQ